MKEKDLKHSKIRTDTTRFVIPQLGYSLEEIDTEYFINAYMWTNLALDSQVLSLVYTKKNPILENEPHITKTITSEYIVYYYPSKKLSKFLKLFLKGRYSKFTKEQKQNILNFWKLYKHSRLSNILYPTDHLLEVSVFFSQKTIFNKEIWPKPNTLKETFTKL